MNVNSLQEKKNYYMFDVLHILKQYMHEKGYKLYDSGEIF